MKKKNPTRHYELNDNTFANFVRRVRVNDCTLTEITLHDRIVQNAFVQSLAGALCRNTIVKKLCIANANLNKSSLQALIVALTQNQTLQVFQLQNVNFEECVFHKNYSFFAESKSLRVFQWNQSNRKELTEAQYQSMAAALCKNSTLTFFEVSGCTDEAAAAFAQVLMQNRTLQTIKLAGFYEWKRYRSGIGCNGAKALACAVSKNSTLKVLDLSHNNIGCNGATALACALSQNSTLKVLNFSQNSIGNDGAVALSQALSCNKSLHTFEAEMNLFDSEGVTALERCLNVNTSLLEMDLTGSLSGLRPCAAKLILRNQSMLALRTKFVWRVVAMYRMAQMLCQRQLCGVFPLAVVRNVHIAMRKICWHALPVYSRSRR